MAKRNWFRNKSWNAEIEKAFMGKLSKARSQRDQYIVIQALTLASTKPDIALKLIELYHDTKTTNFHNDQALLTQINAHESLGNIETVVNFYEQAISLQRSSINFKLNFIFFVTSQNITTQYEAAFKLLAVTLDNLVFVVDEFKWNSSKAILLKHKGDCQGAMNYALKALALSKVKDSALRYHPDVGFVGKEYGQTILKLNAITQAIKDKNI